MKNDWKIIFENGKIIFNTEYDFPLHQEIKLLKDLSRETVLYTTNIYLYRYLLLNYCSNG